MFGERHGCYFNPYTVHKADKKFYHQIPRPKGVQPGRDGFLIHEAIGLRSDYNFYCSIWHCVRKAVIKYQPKTIIIEDEKKPGLQWAHYSLAAQERIFEYVNSQ
ncbi:hypothetical protein FRC12_010414 [Ceratobasidium sp. 428]|nr:hypothetical protein FRC12_010414 [Ceratobasidium sp. 428]